MGDKTMNTEKKITKLLAIVLSMVLSAAGVYASEIVPGTNHMLGDEVPFVEGHRTPSAAPGYAWCLEKRRAVMQTINERVLVRDQSWYYETVQPVYESKMETIMVEPEQKKAILVSPACYKTVCEKKLVQPEGTDYKTVPACYEWADETVEVVPARTEKVFVPARYETYTERIMVRPERTVREEVPGCDTDGSKIDCYATRVIPAEFKIIEKKRLVEPARTTTQVIPAETRVMKVRKVISPARVEKVVIPAKYEQVSKKVLDRPAEYRYETIPAKYRTIERNVMVTPETKRRVDVPAKYETVTRMRVVKPERLVWVLKRNQSVSACPIETTVRSDVIIQDTSKGETVEIDNLVDRYGQVPGTKSVRNK